MMQRVRIEIQRGRFALGLGMSGIIAAASISGSFPADVDFPHAVFENLQIPLWEEMDWAEVPFTADPVVVAQRKGYPSEAAIAAILSHEHPEYSQRVARRIARDILGLCQRYGFTPGFILGLIHVESRFHPSIESHAGAVGLMQVKPSTAESVAKRLNLPWNGKATLQNPHHNLQIGFEYLHQLRSRLPFRKQYVTAYNWGPTRIQRYVEQRKNLPLDYYKKVIRFGKRYAHIDQIAEN